MSTERFFGSPASLNNTSRLRLGRSFASPNSLDTSHNNNKTSNTFNNYYNVQSSFFSFQKYQSMLPYRVIETLSTANFKNISASLSESGWAWIVSGRKCYAWRYMEDAGNITGSVPKAPKCYELILPQSELSHKAELVCVISSIDNRSKFPSALAVSPEGLLRYWPNISQENNTIDQPGVFELQGQECLCLVDIQPLGCILGTTTNSLMHITFVNGQDVTGRASLSCRVLKSPQSLISGIGRRFSSLLFGPQPSTHSSEAKQLIRIARNVMNGENDLLFPVSIVMLTNCFIQKWTISDQNLENLSGEVNLERFVKEAFVSELWDPSMTHYNQLKVYPIDLALKQSNDALLLFLCINSDVPNGHALGLFTISSLSLEMHESSSQTLASVFDSFQILRNMTLPTGVRELLRKESNADLIFSSLRHTFKLVCPLDDPQDVCYIYNPSSLFRVNLNTLSKDLPRMEQVDFNAVGDFLISMVTLDQGPMLLTFKNGFVTIRSSHVDSISNKPLCEDDRQFLLANNDKKSVLSKALNLYAKGQKKRAELLVQKSFNLNSGEPEARSKFELDDIVVGLSSDILDQIPGCDPRWAHSTSSMQEDVPSTDNVNSVILSNQLEEKYSTHALFIELLQSSKAFDLLTNSSTSNLPSKLMLCEHTEKLLAALQLIPLSHKYRHLIQTAINKVIKTRNYLHEHKQQHLTDHDFFFREITKIDDIFWSLIEIEEDAFNKEMEKEFFDLALSISDIISIVFVSVCSYRETNGMFYQSEVVYDCDYVPWSSSRRISNIRETLLKHLDLITKALKLDQRSRSMNDERLSSPSFFTLAQKIGDVVDIVLDNYVCQLKHLSPSNEKHNILKADFQANRYKCLLVLIQLEQFEKAAALAEKYEDFDILIKICEELNDVDKLNAYLAQYANKGFPEHLFEWYLREGKQNKLLLNVSNNHKLADFLTNHHALNWLHQIHLGHFRETSSILRNLATIENLYPERKKTLLSIAKLAAIAAGQTDYSEFDDNIALVNLQASLPESLLKPTNLEKDALKVLSPEHLIILLTADLDDLDECFANYEKCLDILDIMQRRSPRDQFERAQLHVWQKAFLMDDWSSCRVDDAEDVIKNSFFYRLASTHLGSNVQEKIPELSSMVDALQQVAENDKISFFLKALYECLTHA